jgi:hypothetical protein
MVDAQVGGSSPSAENREKGDRMAKVPDTPENGDRCICGECPSYPKERSLFCATGKSEKPVVKRGCVCNDCQVFKEYSLQDGYYCANGAAGEGAE